MKKVISFVIMFLMLVGMTNVSFCKSTGMIKGSADDLKLTLNMSVPSTYLKQKGTMQAKMLVSGTTTDKVKWKSGDETKATVDKDGKITASSINSGRVKITASVGDVSVSKTIFVWNASLTGQYYTYSTEKTKSSEKGAIANGRKSTMYFSLEESKDGSYKILDYAGGSTTKNKSIKGRYFSSNIFSSRYWTKGNFIHPDAPCASWPSKI